MRRSHTFVVGVLVICLGMLVSARQPPGQNQSPPRPGVIFGQVVDADSKQPIPGAIISVAPTVAVLAADPTAAAAAATARRVMADAEGRFVLRDVRPGSVTVSLTATTYINATFGQRRPGGPGRALVIDSGEVRGPVQIAMWKPAVIEGRVVDEHGEPVVRAEVFPMRRLWQQGRLTYQTTLGQQTDDKGRFRLPGLVPGEYVVVVPMTHTAVPASVAAESRRQMEAGGAPAQEFSRRMQASGAALSVLGSGEPVGNMVVMRSAVTHSPSTEGHEGVYASAYVPAIDRGETDLLSLKSGQEVTGVEIALTPVRPVSVSGTLIGPDGPLGMTGVRLATRHLGDQSIGGQGDVARTVTTAAGAFTFMAVPPGEYQLIAQVIPRPDPTSGVTIIQGATGAMSTTVRLAATAPAAPTDPTLSAVLALSVGNRAIDGLLVTAGVGSRVRGTVEFVGAAAKPTPDQTGRATVTVRPVDGVVPLGLMPGRVNDEGTFETMGFPHGRYLVTASLPSPGWYFESARVGGRDVSIEPLELDGKDIENLVVTFTDTRTELRGQVRPASGDDADATVIVFPSNLTEWIRHGMNPRLLSVTRPNTTGQYVVSGLPAGTYLVAAVPAPVAEEPGNPEFLATLARQARTVSLTRGQPATLDLTVGPDRLEARSEPILPEERPSGPWAPDDQQARDTAAAPVGTGAISGVVTLDDAQQTPVRRAQVRLAGSAATGVSNLAVTDGQGRFAFRDLPEGRYTLSAFRPGLVSVSYGATAPGRAGLPIALATGQQMADLKLTMLRGAAIEGRLIDEFGRPVERAQVQLLEFRLVNGVRTLGPAGSASMPFAATDDRGIYRLYGIAPGEYVIAASLRTLVTGAEVRRSTTAEWEWAARRAAQGPTPAGGPQEAPPPALGPAVGATGVYYPGTTNPDAAGLVAIRAGEERTGIDFVVSLVPTATVTGRVEMPDGSPPSQLQMNLLAQSRLAGGIITPPTFVRTTPDGRFTAAGLAPGTYTIVARAAEAGAKPTPPTPGGRGGGPQTLKMWAQQDIQVDGTDLSGVVIPLAPGMTVSGRITFEGATPAPTDVSRASVRLNPMQTTGVTVVSPMQSTQDDGTFRIEGNTPGGYRVLANAPWRNGALPTWVLSRAMLGGVDVADIGLEIVAGRDIADLELVFTDKVSEISGAITDGLGRPASEYSLIVFPAEAALRVMGTRRTPPAQRADTAGRFRIPGLPPGDYFLAAITPPEPGQAYDAAFFNALVPSAVKFTLAEGERKVQDLRLAIER